MLSVERRKYPTGRRRCSLIVAENRRANIVCRRRAPLAIDPVYPPDVPPEECGEDESETALA